VSFIGRNREPAELRRWFSGIVTRPPQLRDQLALANTPATSPHVTFALDAFCEISRPAWLGWGTGSAMNRLSLTLLLVTGLALTAYFGTTAWRLSESSGLDITSNIPPAPHTGWQHAGAIKR